MSDAPRPADGRAGWVLSQLYYYAAAVAGFGMMLGGLIAVVFGIRHAILPGEFESAREGLRGMAHGFAVALPGATILWWHLREARRREVGEVRGIFWGRSLYFHLMALVALAFVIVGSQIALHAVVDLAAPSCPEIPAIAVPAGGEGEIVFSDCYPSRDEGMRRLLDGVLFLAVATPFWWWHLRQGRRLGAVATPDA